MRKLVTGCLGAMLVVFAALAQSSVDATGAAYGKAVLWFSGTHVTALIESDFTVSGSVDIDGACVGFSAQGVAFGEGVGDSAAMTLDVWLLFEADGETDEGMPIILRGGIAGSSENSDLAASALGSATGPFFLVVVIGSNAYHALGTAEGSAAGAFVVPDDPLTMQMEGTGTYSLCGDLVADGPTSDPSSNVLSCLPWDPASWPADLYGELLALLDGAASNEPEDEAADG